MPGAAAALDIVTQNPSRGIRAAANVLLLNEKHYSYTKIVEDTKKSILLGEWVKPGHVTSKYLFCMLVFTVFTVFTPLDGAVFVLYILHFLFSFLNMPPVLKMLGTIGMCCIVMVGYPPSDLTWVAFRQTQAAGSSVKVPLSLLERIILEGEFQ